MFTIDTDITDLKIKERNLYQVFFSLNIHQVATPELSAEDAKSYVFFFQESGRYLAYIGLHFLRTDRKLYYRHSANPFSESELPDVEEEARSFAEDMGAMLDELGLAKMSDMEKDRWIDEQDIFSSRQKTVEQPATAAGAQLQQAEPSAPAQPAPVAESIAAPVSVQPAPASQVAPAVPPAPSGKSAPIQQAPVTRPEPIEQPVPEPAPAPAGQTLVEEPSPSQPQIKQAPAPRQPAARPKTAAPVSASRPSAEEVMEQAVKAGIVKAPQQPLKKDIRSSTGGVASRDKEALARLLASF
jgi:hypothetical protein